MGSFHKMSVKDLDRYLYEMEWRFNNRDSTLHLLPPEIGVVRVSPKSRQEGFQRGQIVSVAEQVVVEARLLAQPLLAHRQQFVEGHGKVVVLGEDLSLEVKLWSRRRDRVASAMFLNFFGRDRRPATLSQRDWDRFIQARRAGRAGRSGQPVGNRTIEWDLTFLLTVLNWAARSRDEEGKGAL